MSDASYGNGTLPPQVRSRIISGINGLDVHLLEAGHETPGRPLALLLHGFPDLAYGWRHLMPILAEAGFHVVAPDQRGYGRTTGWMNDYDAALGPFSLLNMVRDALALTLALGYRHTTLLVGHDLGSPVAAYCALARPDVFRSLVLMSAPFPGAPVMPFDTAAGSAGHVLPAQGQPPLAAALAALEPPRAFYQHYLCTRQANHDMWYPPQGMQAFLRAFYHVKSGDWAGNRPHPLMAATASELAQMPAYYVMELGATMPESVAPFLPSLTEIQANDWLSAAELEIYVEEYTRTGFQGALQAYRVLSDPDLNAELRLFSGRTIDVPSIFIGGDRDWGTYAAPGALDLMTARAVPGIKAVELIAEAGHWIQQEQPVRLAELMLDFVAEARDGFGKASR
ncbi:alpha/beta hydrolase [Frateuria aurantia]